MSPDQWLQDVHWATRAIRRAPTFYFAAVLTLAVGITGAIVMFTLIRGILLRPLPVADEQRLVVSWRTPRSGIATHVPYRAADVEEMARVSQSLEQVTGVGYNGAFDVTWLDGASSIQVRTAAVMGDFFRVAGVAPVLGRVLTAGDDRTGAEPVTVLSYGAWQRLFGGSREVIGRRLVTAEHAFTIVGVTPADFEYPRGTEIWATLGGIAATESNEAFRAGLLNDVEVLARLRGGVTYQQAASELANVMAVLDLRAPGADGSALRPVVRPFKQVVVGDVDAALVVLFSAVGLLLVISSANVANLFMVRAESRRSELVVRAALGATRHQLIRQMLVESLIVALAAAAVALPVSRWSVETVVLLVPDGLPRLSSIRIDATVIVFTAGVAFLVAALSGLAPAVSVSRLNLVADLRAGGRGLVRQTRRSLRPAFVVAQVALAVAVVAAAGLLVRSLDRLQRAEMGLAARQLVFAELDLPRERYADQDRHRQLLDTLLERVNAAPGVTRATPINALPFAGATGWDVPRFTAEGQGEPQVAENPSLNLEAVHATYFDTFGVPILRGRPFTAADTEATGRVAIVSLDVAALAWPQQDPVGKRLKMGGLASRDEWLTIVGVAGRTRYRELATPRPTLYVPAEQFMITASRLAIRTTAEPLQVAAAVAAIVKTIDPGIRVVRVARFSDYLRVPLAWPRFNALLLGIFAVAALLLSSIGLYGVMATSVRQRYGEIGIRVALGATSNDVRRLVLGEGLRLAAAGLVGGLALALIGTRGLRGLLFEIQPLDPPTLLFTAVALVGASLLASYLPARRAAHVDPVEMLRAE